MSRPIARVRILAGILAYMCVISAFDLITAAPVSAASPPAVVVVQG